jgi:hypothetical protein
MYRPWYKMFRGDEALMRHNIPCQNVTKRLNFQGWIFFQGIIWPINGSAHTVKNPSWKFRNIFMKARTLSSIFLNFSILSYWFLNIHLYTGFGSKLQHTFFTVHGAMSKEMTSGNVSSEYSTRLTGTSHRGHLKRSDYIVFL